MTSPGIRSGVNWMRLKSSDSAAAKRAREQRLRGARARPRAGRGPRQSSAHQQEVDSAASCPTTTAVDLARAAAQRRFERSAEVHGHLLSPAVDARATSVAPRGATDAAAAASAHLALELGERDGRRARAATSSSHARSSRPARSCGGVQRRARRPASAHRGSARRASPSWPPSRSSAAVLSIRKSLAGARARAATRAAGRSGRRGGPQEQRRESSPPAAWRATSGNSNRALPQAGLALEAVHGLVEDDRPAPSRARSNRVSVSTALSPRRRPWLDRECESETIQSTPPSWTPPAHEDAGVGEQDRRDVQVARRPGAAGGPDRAGGRPIAPSRSTGSGASGRRRAAPAGR